METVNPDYLISLYTQLRDPTGQSVNEASTQLNSFLQVPQSIVCLFEVENNIQDPIIRSFAALNIRDYLIIHKKNISEEVIQNVRKSIIQSLVKEENATTRLQIINVVSILIDSFPGDWPDLNQFLYSDNFLPFLPSILQILTIIFPKLTDEVLSARMQYFMNVILAGFQSDDLSCNCCAVSFFYSIMIRVNDVSRFTELQGPLFQLFQTILNSNDVQMLTQFLEPISIGINNNIIFLPTDKILQFIIPILSSDAEIDIKSHINDLLGLHLQFETDQISTEVLQQIFDLETNLAIQLYELSTDDPTLSCLHECTSVFKGIYMRIPEETVEQMSIARFNQLVEQKQPQFLLSAISVITSAITLIPENFDNIISDIFPKLLSFLGNPDQYVQKFASDSLSNIADDFSEFITVNLSTIVETVIYFIQQTGGAQGTHLLSSIMSITELSDDIFPSLLPQIIEWMRSSEGLIKQNASMILSSMIENSQTQVPYFVEQIAQTVISLLKESLEFQYSAFIVVYSLCHKVPDSMSPYVSELYPIIMAGIHSQDVSVKGEAVRIISVLPRIFQNNQNFQNEFMTIFKEALTIANAPIDGPVDDQILTISGEAVKRAASLVKKSNNSQLLPPILSAIVHVAHLPSMNCLSCAAKGFKKVIKLMSTSPGNIDEITNPTEEMIQLLIEKLTDSSRYEFSILRDIIDALAVTLSCGVEILKHKELELITILSSVLTQTMNPYTGAILCPEDVLDPISMLFIGISFSTEANTKEILDTELPMLSNLLNHKNYQYQVFSIKTFAELISRNSTMMLIPAEMKTQLIQNMLKRIDEAIPNVASAAAKFIYQICINEESLPLLEECVVPAVTSLMARLQSITNLTKENIIMRENIILAIATIGSYILKEQFPVAEAMPTILKALPIVKQFKPCYNEVYKFLNSMSYLVSPELHLEYIRIYAWVFARSHPLINDPNFRNSIFMLLCNMSIVLERFLNAYPPEQQKEIIERSLDQDSYKMSCFAAVLDLIRKTFNINQY